MIIKELVQYLTNYFADDQSLFVGCEAPEQFSNYVLVDQTGSSTRNHITTATVAVQSYGETLLKAMELNETVKTAVLSFAGQADVASVRLETDYNFTNTATKQYRWQAVYQITHY